MSAIIIVDLRPA